MAGAVTSRLGAAVQIIWCQCPDWLALGDQLVDVWQCAPDTMPTLLILRGFDVFGGGEYDVLTYPFRSVRPKVPMASPVETRAYASSVRQLPVPAVPGG